MSSTQFVKAVSVPLEREGFFNQLLQHLTGALQDTVGLEEAEGFISAVGQKIGDDINDSYRQALQLPALNPEQVGAVVSGFKKTYRRWLQNYRAR